MLIVYTGTPGSGKSLHLARRIQDELRIRKHAVIANFPINLDVVSKNGKRKTGNFIYRQNHEITVEFLIEYAMKHHKAGVESQALLVFDEAGLMFNARDYGSSDRKSWLEFMMTHRHYGYDIILVSQYDRMLDRQIRYLIEYEFRHRKASNFGKIGFIFFFLRIPLFVAIKYWYPIHEREGADFFRYRKRDSKLYDTMMLFGGDKHGKKIGLPPSGSDTCDGDAERSEEGPHCEGPIPTTETDNIASITPDEEVERVG